MLRSLDLRVDVVVAEIPVLVRADDLTAARAENLLAALDARQPPGVGDDARPIRRARAASASSGEGRDGTRFATDAASSVENPRALERTDHGAGMGGSRVSRLAHPR